MSAVINSQDDKLLLGKLRDLHTACQRKGRPAFSDFLNPVQIGKFLTFFTTQEAAVVQSYGGYLYAERQMLGFFPDEAERARDFPIRAVSLTYNARFNAAPAHRDYLGAVLGLGLERTKIGDIRLTESGALLYVSQDIADYVATQMESVGRVPVKAAIVPLDRAEEAQPVENDGTETRLTVASLRLDAVVSGAFRLSRSKAAALIVGEKVFVNWVCVTETAKHVAEGDVVTVRGLGRVRLDTAAGRTKKDRIVLLVRKS